MFAIIESGGKQFKVVEGQTILVDLLEEPQDNKVTFENVLLVSKDDEVLVGKPVVENATVEGEYVREEKGKKIDVFKMKRRKSTKKRTGHRQHYSMVKIVKIDVADGAAKKTVAAKAVVSSEE